MIKKTNNFGCRFDIYIYFIYLELVQDFVHKFVTKTPVLGEDYLRKQNYSQSVLIPIPVTA